MLKLRTLNTCLMMVIHCPISRINRGLSNLCTRQDQAVQDLCRQIALEMSCVSFEATEKLMQSMLKSIIIDVQ